MYQKVQIRAITKSVDFKTIDQAVTRRAPIDAFQIQVEQRLNPVNQNPGPRKYAAVGAVESYPEETIQLPISPRAPERKLAQLSEN